MNEALVLFGLSNTYTDKDIKRAYRRLAKIHHPVSLLGPTYRQY